MTDQKNSSLTKRFTFGVVLWLVALTVMAGFQTWRGSYADGVLFAAVAILLAVDRAMHGRLTLGIPSLRVPTAVMRIAAAVSAVLLVTIPRHGTFSFFAMTFIGVIMFALAWGSDVNAQTQAPPQTVRSAWWWILLGVALSVWEAAAFVLSVSVPGAYYNHPTLSVLLDPLLEGAPGRIVFVTLWVLAGVGLVSLWRRK